MTLRITPLHPMIGAQAEGIDLRRPPKRELVTQIEAAMDLYAVLVFPDQVLSQGQHVAFAQRFGPIDRSMIVEVVMRGWSGTAWRPE